jgi:RHS repeat-associated protein
VAGKVISYVTYDSWGKLTAKAILKTGVRELDLVQSYTVHPYDQVLELFFAQARMYDPVTLRWLSMDPIKGVIEDPQSMNQYVYVLNNPLKYIDPFGLNPIDTLTSIEQNPGEMGVRVKGDSGIRLYYNVRNVYAAFRSGASVSYDAESNTALLRLTYGNTTAFIKYSMSGATHGSFIDATVTYDYENKGDVVGVIQIQYIDQGDGARTYINLANLRYYFKEIFCEDYLSKPDKTDSWINLYDNPTVARKGRAVAKHPNAANYDWGMPEELYPKNVPNSGDLPLNSRTQIANAGGTPKVIVTSNNLYTDADGRYWVAVGPNVMNSQQTPNQLIDYNKISYGTKIDIVVQDSNNNTYYIPAVLGDLKEHSSPDGLYQTGVPFDPSRGTYTGDGSTVEFLGYYILDKYGNFNPSGANSSVNITNNYKITEIIVYDGALNY